MNNSLLARYKQSTFIILVFALLASILLFPLASNNIPFRCDYINHLATIVQANLALAEGQLPLRVAPFEHEGFRYPLFQFYSPTSYMVAGLIYRWVSPNNPYIAFKLTLWLSLLVSALYMYRTVAWISKSTYIALLAGIVFLSAPYNIFLIDHNGGFTEALAICVIPIVLYYLFQSYYFPRQKFNVLISAVMWYLLATTHLLTFLLTISFTIALLSITTLQNKRWKNAIPPLLSILFGILLAMWYFGPVVSLHNYLTISNDVNSHITYNLSHTFWKMFIPTPIHEMFNLYNQSLYLDMLPTLGLPLLLSSIACAVIYFMNLVKKTEFPDELILPLLILSLFGFFVMWSPFDFWNWLPSAFIIIQFPWRILSQLMWINTLLFAFVMVWLNKKNHSNFIILLSVLFITLPILPWISYSPTKQAIPISKINNNPHLVFNTKSYLLLPRVYKTANTINVVDNVQLDSFVDNHKLVLNKPIFLSNDLVAEAYNPYILLQGLVPNSKRNPQELIATINGQPFSTHPLKPGFFEWSIPLKRLQYASNIHPPYRLQFSLNSKEIEPTYAINILTNNLYGFLNPAFIIDASKTQSLCHWQHLNMHCEINASPITKLIELPLFFYPKLLHLTNNGETIPYASVLVEDHMIVGIIAKPGMNNIDAQFIGLPWANFTSSLAFGLWILTFIYLLLKRLSTS